ncbi:Myb-like DNA-binding protein BAS1 [Kluyveromyces marxianus]
MSLVSDGKVSSSGAGDESNDFGGDESHGSMRKKMKKEPVNALEVSESLGYQTFRRKMRKIWSKDEDELLRKLVNEALVKLGFVDGIKSIKTIEQSSEAAKKIPWDELAEREEFENKRATDVKKRWTSSLDPVLRKGKWTPEEDELLLKSYEEHGPQWLKISYVLKHRTEDQCAKRYIEVLDPSTKDRLRPWDEEEDVLLIAKVKKYGTKWRQISTEMDARPSLTCRNRWRKIITMVVRGAASEKVKSAVQAGNTDAAQELMDLKAESDKEERNASRSGSVSPSDEQKIPPPLPQQQLEPQPQSQPQSQPASQTASRPVSRIASPQDSIRSAHSDTKREESSPMVFCKTNAAASLLNSLKKSRSPAIPNANANTPDQSSVLNSFRSPSPQFPSNQTHASLLSDHHSVKKDSALPSPGNLLHIPLAEPKRQQPETTVDWKFTLKESSGHTLSNGVISDMYLVKQLIEHAKSNDLKISIHQHIHNHYLAPRQASPPPLMVHQHPRAGTNSAQELPRIRSPSFSDLDADFLAKTPNFQTWSLEEENPSPYGLNDKLQRFYHHHHHHHHDSQVQGNTNGNNVPVPMNTASSNTSYASPAPPEIREIGPSRHSHFNYLPPTLKPQLGSSESTKPIELSRLLNPSPGSSYNNKKRRSKRKHKSDSRNSSAAGSTGNTPGDDSASRNKVTPSSRSSLSVMEEDGNDFWENLRSLGGNIGGVQESPNMSNMNELFQGNGNADTPSGYDAIFKLVEQGHSQSQSHSQDQQQGTEETSAEFTFNPS